MRRVRKRVKYNYSHAFEEFSAWLDGNSSSHAAKLLLKRVLHTAQQVIVCVLLVFECQAAITDVVQVFEPFKVRHGHTTSINV